MVDVSSAALVGPPVLASVVLDEVARLVCELEDSSAPGVSELTMMGSCGAKQPAANKESTSPDWRWWGTFLLIGRRLRLLQTIWPVAVLPKKQAPAPVYGPARADSGRAQARLTCR